MANIKHYLGIVNKEKIEQLMLQYFSACPLCSVSKGYDVQGWTVKCRSCGAQWMSTNFFKCKDLKELTLLRPSQDGKGSSLAMKKYPIEFWQNPEAIETESETLSIDMGLLEGEKKKLEYVCARQFIGSPSMWDGQRAIEQRKGRLILTNDNLIFTEQQGPWSSNYMQALRIPLEEISGVSSGGVLIKHLRVLVGTASTTEHHFTLFERQDFDMIVAEIQKHLKETREEKKRIAKEALAKGTVPAMIFCRFCGTRNKSDQSFCANCGAPLT